MAVVTGAASGLGQALAVELARRGHDVVGGDLPGASWEATDRAVREAGGALTPLEADVRQADALQALADAARSRGEVGAWVNNAGVAVAGEVGAGRIEDWRWLIDINVMGVAHGMHVAVPLLRGQGRGGILNVASAAGLVSSPGMAAYNASKAAVVSMTETLAAELLGTPIRATVLCPTFFQTNLLETARSEDPRHLRLAAKLMARSAWTAADVARVGLDDLEAGRLYSVPMADGRWLWRLRRGLPQQFPRLFARAARLLG